MEEMPEDMTTEERLAVLLAENEAYKKAAVPRKSSWSSAMEWVNGLPVFLQCLLACMAASFLTGMLTGWLT